VYVQDLAVWIPLALVSARLMWNRRTWGVLLSVSMLTFYVVECLSVASDQWWGARADDSHPELASLSVVPAALLLAAVTAAVLVWSIVHFRRSSSCSPSATSVASPSSSPGPPGCG
jgi:hypothetical protein